MSETKWLHSKQIAFFGFATIFFLSFSGVVRAQQSPDAPTRSDNCAPFRAAIHAPEPAPKDSSTEQKSPVDQTVGILSRRSIFFPDLATNRCPLTSTEKFKLFVDKTISPSTWVSAGFSAAEKQAFNTYPGYGQGWQGYGKRYGAAIANSASTNFLGTFLFPSLFHQDPRHFFYSRPGTWKKIEYAIGRQVVTRTDSGGNAFNWSRILSVIAAEGIANSYLPPDERTVGKTLNGLETASPGVLEAL